MTAKGWWRENLNKVFVSSIGDRTIAYSALSNKFYEVKVANSFNQLSATVSRSRVAAAMEQIQSPCRTHFRVPRASDHIKWLKKIMVRDQQQRAPILRLEITSDCNFSCSYCLQKALIKKRKNSEISIDSAYSAIDNFIENHTSHRIFIVYFYGGEPLLKPELIDAIIRYCYDKYKRLSFIFALSTNGFLLNDQVVEMLHSFDIIVYLSFDIIPMAQNSNRMLESGGLTHDNVLGNLRVIQKIYPDFYNNNIRIVCTFDPNVGTFPYKRAHKSNHILRDLPVIYNPLDGGTLANNPSDSITPLLNIRQFKYYLDEPLVKQYIEFISALFQTDVDSSYRIYVKGNCLPGTGECYVDVDGYIRYCSKSVTSPIIGDAANYVDSQLLEKILLKYYNTIVPICSDCYAVRFCSPCLIKHYSEEGGIKRNETYCDETRKTFHKFTQNFLNLVT